MGYITVKELINELLKHDPNKIVLMGDTDKYGRNDVQIHSIVLKQHGYDDSNESYIVLTGGEGREGCIKY